MAFLLAIPALIGSAPLAFAVEPDTAPIPVIESDLLEIDDAGWLVGPTGPVHMPRPADESWSWPRYPYPG